MATKTFGHVAGNWSDDTKWEEGSKPAAGDDVVFDAASANCEVDENSATLKSLDMTGYTGTLSGKYIVSVVGAAASTVVVKLAGTITWNAALLLAPAATTTNINLTTNGKLLYRLNIAGSKGKVNLQDGLNFAETKGPDINIYSGDVLNLNGQIISGNSIINRVIINSRPVGTAKIIIVGGGSFANCDFRDILFNNGGADLDLSGITGLSGDCGGNGMSGGGELTLTAPAAQTWNGTTGNWSDNTKWTSRVPLPQDNVVLAGTNTVTADMPRLGKDISFSGATPLTLGNAVTSYGSLDFTNSGTLTAGSNNWTFESQARSGTLNLTSNNKTFGNIFIQTFGATLQTQDDLHTGCFDLIAGTFTTNHDIFAIYAVLRNNTTANMGSGTWTLSRSSGTVWCLYSGCTFNAQNSTIFLSDTGSGTKIFDSAFSLKTYNNVVIAGGGSGIVQVNYSNVYNNFTINAPKTVSFQAGTTQTINGTFTATGTAANKITINSSAAGVAYLSKASGAVICDHLILSKSSAGGGATWFAGSNSQDGGDNSGWLWQDPPKPMGQNSFNGNPMGGMAA